MVNPGTRRASKGKKARKTLRGGLFPSIFAPKQQQQPIRNIGKSIDNLAYLVKSIEVAKCANKNVTNYSTCRSNSNKAGTLHYCDNCTLYTRASKLLNDLKAIVPAEKQETISALEKRLSAAKPRYNVTKLPVPKEKY